MTSLDIPATLAKTYADLPGQWPFTGGILGIVTKEGVTHHLPFGQDFDHKEISSRTPFLIGSISKFFTGLMIADLVEKGVCDPDRPASDILPWLKIGSDYPEPSLRHLLHHTAGLVKGADDPPDELAQCWSLRDSQTASQPGTFFHYSNLGYNILGLIISRLTGRHATDHAQATLLSPLGMTDSFARLESATRGYVATGGQPARDDIPWRPGLALASAPWIEAEGGDGSIAASSGDMARLITALLNNGQIDGKQAISTAALRRATTDLTHEGEGNIEGFGSLPVTQSRYGYGINVETVGTHACFTHGGGMIGHSSFLLVDQTAGLGICVLTNANGCYAVGEALARHTHASLISKAMPAARLDLAFGTDCSGYDPRMIGYFQSCESHDAGPAEIQIFEESQRLYLRANGITGKIWRSWGTRMMTDHPQMEHFHLVFDGSGKSKWLFGPRVYALVGSLPNKMPPATRKNDYIGLTGRYRSYSPWCPTFRIVIREGRLWLISPGGVEGPDCDMELVKISDTVFRIGADPRLPERLIIDQMLEGRPVTVFRDSCRYSKMSFN
ncbi:serine hydrolase domain-containing protein [Brucella sp. TWI432]